MEKRVELADALEQWKLMPVIVGDDPEEPAPETKRAEDVGWLVKRLRRLLARLESNDDSSGGHGGPGFFERSSTMDTMEKTQEEGAVQKPVEEKAVEGIRLPPRPPDGQPIKAAAVQQRLKAERVQEALKALPGWRLTARSKAIDRVYSFTTATLATAFAGYVTEAARLAEMPVDLSVAGTTLVVTLSAPLRGGGCGVTEGVLDFAKQLR